MAIPGCVSYNSKMKWKPLIAALALPLGLVAVALLPSACAQQPKSVNWQNPDVPREQWSEDMGQCRRMARREAEREAGTAASESVSGGIGTGLSSYNSSMSRFELKRYEARVYADCMRRLGYTPIAKQ